MKFNIKFSYEKYEFGGVKKSQSPLIYEFGCSYFVSLSSSSKEEVKFAIIRGGAEFNGEFFVFRTDPKVILKYHYSQKKIELIAEWSIQRMKTEVKGGLFLAHKKFRGIRLKWIYKHFSQFTIKNSYKKWTIFKKSWSKKLSLPIKYSKPFPIHIPKPYFRIRRGISILDPR